MRTLAMALLFVVARDMLMSPGMMTHEYYLSTVAQAYERAEHTPQDAAVRQVYDTLNLELWGQFLVLSAFVRVTFTPVDPYGSSAEMFQSLERGSLSVYSGGVLPSGHPFTAIAPNGEPYNNIFRAVHDGLAHYPERNSFGVKGEFKAYLAHCRLLSPLAQRALFTETVGQNAWYHFGPRAHETPKPYADQKATLLPFALQLTAQEIQI